MYLLVMIGIGAAAGLALALAAERGALHIWLTAFGLVAMVVGLGVLDYLRIHPYETALHVYLLVATVPTLASTLVVRSFTERPGVFGYRVFSGLAAWLGMASMTIGVTTFG